MRSKLSSEIIHNTTVLKMKKNIISNKVKRLSQIKAGIQEVTCLEGIIPIIVELKNKNRNYWINTQLMWIIINKAKKRIVNLMTIIRRGISISAKRKRIVNLMTIIRGGMIFSTKRKRILILKKGMLIINLKTLVSSRTNLIKKEDKEKEKLFIR